MENWSFEILLHYNSVNLRPRSSLYLNPKAIDYWTKVLYFSLRVNLYKRNLERNKSELINNKEEKWGIGLLRFYFITTASF